MSTCQNELTNTLSHGLSSNESMNESSKVKNINVWSRRDFKYNYNGK